MSYRMVVVIREDKVSAMTMSTRGMVRRWLRGFAREVMALSVLRTPVRTGKMKVAWREGIDSYSPLHAKHLVRNKAKHAAYVFRGTRGPIRPKKGRFLAVGASQYGKGSPLVVFRREVRGQAANNIPMKALREVMVRRGM